MTRLMILTFWGTPRDGDRFGHAHESGPTMAIPWWPFCRCFPSEPGSSYTMCSRLKSGWTFTRFHGAHDVHGVVLGVSLLALGAGLALAVAMYVWKTPDPAWVAGRFPALYQLVTVRYFDRFYLYLSDVAVF
jgi:NADH:ubiquinone oxidoreductase subunit 5 (subunit L)/multisubunit Na+/H+ antiporter MnhA subunit